MLYDDRTGQALTARAFGSIVQTLWVFPRAGELDTETDLFRTHLMAYRSRRGANEQRRRDNTYSSYTIPNAWRNVCPQPIEFSVHEPMHTQGPNRYAGNAPLVFWAVADLSNGHIWDPDGRVWLFAFNSRADARRYMRETRRRNPSCIRFSEPFRMWQQPR